MKYLLCILMLSSGLVFACNPTGGSCGATSGTCCSGLTCTGSGCEQQQS